MNRKSHQEFIAAGVAGVTGIVILAASWSEFRAVAETHPSITMFALGLMLVFMAAGNLSIGLKKRSWLKQMEKEWSTTTASTATNEPAAGGSI